MTRKIVLTVLIFLCDVPEYFLKNVKAEFKHF